MRDYGEKGFPMKIDDESIRKGCNSFVSVFATSVRDIVKSYEFLMVPFQRQYYYTEAMQGSYSIKYVLPALCPGDPELNYHNLDQVHNGSEASAAFAGMADLSPEKIQELRSNLLKYCGLDTYAMVKVLEKLKQISS